MESACGEAAARYLNESRVEPSGICVAKGIPLYIYIYIYIYILTYAYMHCTLVACRSILVMIRDVARPLIVPHALSKSNK